MIHSTDSDLNIESSSAEEESDIDYARAKKKRRVSQDSDPSDRQLGVIGKGQSVRNASRVKIRAARTNGETAAVEPEKSKIVAATTTTTATFGNLGVQPWLVSALSTMAIIRPTAIQKGCIPEIIKGRDCIGGSRTGSGKTMAFAIPILQKWSEDPVGIFALVLTPTR